MDKQAERKMEVVLLPKAMEVAPEKDDFSYPHLDIAPGALPIRTIIYFAVVGIIAWFIFPHAVVLGVWSFGTLVIGIYGLYIKK